jgi:hypothetical protein
MLSGSNPERFKSALQRNELVIFRASSSTLGYEYASTNDLTSPLDRTAWLRSEPNSFTERSY